MEQARIDRIKTLRQVLADIEAKCGACPIMSTAYCNEGCILPAARVVAETELRDYGEYVNEKTNYLDGKREEIGPSNSPE